MRRPDLADGLAVVNDLGKQLDWNPEQIAEPRIPPTGCKVHQRGARCGGRIGRVAAGEPLDEVAVGCAEAELAARSEVAGAVRVVEKPVAACLPRNSYRAAGRLSRRPASALPRRAISSMTSAVRWSCQTMAGPSGSPVSRSHATTVSPWLARPNAFAPPERRPHPPAPGHWPEVAPRRAPPSPGCGKLWPCGRAAMPGEVGAIEEEALWSTSCPDRSPRRSSGALDEGDLQGLSRCRAAAGTRESPILRSRKARHRP